MLRLFRDHSLSIPSEMIVSSTNDVGTQLDIHIKKKYLSIFLTLFQNVLLLKCNLQSNKTSIKKHRKNS